MFGSFTLFTKMEKFYAVIGSQFIGSLMLGNDGEHLFKTDELFRGRPGCAVTLFGVKIFRRQVCWHNDILDSGISLSTTFSVQVKENRKESQPLHAGARLRRLILESLKRIHTLFIGEVIDAGVLAKGSPLTTREYEGVYLGKD
jgi:hypothetical protein